MDFVNMNIKDIDKYLDSLPMTQISERLDILELDIRSSVKKIIEKYRKRISYSQKEVERLKTMFKYENEMYKNGLVFIAGVDEAGRGPLAGPVFAAAVILPSNIIIHGINDSKKLSEAKREELYKIITENAISYKIVSISESEIDDINIRNATFKGMVSAVEGLEIPPEHVLIDGDGISGLSLPYTTIIQGDSLSVSIAAASILAKVSRDTYIKTLDSVYPQYGFAKNKGYGTKEHIDAIKEHGICPIHRKSFVSRLINR